MADSPLFQAPQFPAPSGADSKPEGVVEDPDDDTVDEDDGEPGSSGNTRRFGRGHRYSGPAYVRRIDHLTRIGRRCEGNGRTCVNAATRRLTVIALDVRTGEPRPGAEPGDVLSCSRHDKTWTRNPVYRLVAREMLPERSPSNPPRPPAV